MDFYTIITDAYPELKSMQPDPFKPASIIAICDDGDGVQYIAKWGYSKPIPDGLHLGKSAT